MRSFIYFEALWNEIKKKRISLLHCIIDVFIMCIWSLNLKYRKYQFWSYSNVNYFDRADKVIILLYVREKAPDTKARHFQFKTLIWVTYRYIRILWTMPSSKCASTNCLLDAYLMSLYYYQFRLYCSLFNDTTFV